MIETINDKFYTLADKVRETIKVVRDRYGIIEAGFVDSEEKLQLLSSYFAYANGNDWLGPIHIDETYYRGTPDWYFLEGSFGSREEPATWHLETLTEKKERFEAFVNRFSYD